MTVKHSTEPQVVMAKTEFTSKARCQPVDALIIVNNPLLFLPKEQGQEPGSFASCSTHLIIAAIVKGISISHSYLLHT